MGMFDGIDKVSSTGGGARLVPGKHRFLINALKAPPGLRTGRCFIAELTVVSTTNPALVEGQSVSWVRNRDGKFPELALGDIKGFIAAAANCDESTIGEAACDAAVTENQPFAGKMIDCDAFDKPFKSDSSKAFTKAIWSPVE
jgi:hypothetical protein